MVIGYSISRSTSVQVWIWVRVWIQVWVWVQIYCWQ